MVLVVLTIAVLNFALGFSLALFWEYWLRPQAPQVVFPSAPESSELEKGGFFARKKVVVEESETTDDLPGAEAEAEEKPPVDIPDEWFALLAEESVETQSFVEASVQVLRLEVGKYRESLLDLEDQIREQSQAPVAEEMALLLEAVKTLNVQWLEKQSVAASCLTASKGDMGDLESTGNELEDILLEQSAQIETTCSNLEVLDFTSEVEAGCKRLLIEIGRLVDLAHSLRDGMNKSLLAIVRREGRLNTIGRALQKDGAAEHLNRGGLEVLFDEWHSDTANRERTLSLVAIDIDHVRKLNSKWSTRCVDRLLHAYAGLVYSLIRHDRGFDRMALIDGERFVLFLGDTGPRNALAAAERIRQTLQATSIDMGGEEIEVRASCGVVEVGFKEGLDECLAHAAKTLRVAKKGGRNGSAIDEGNGPTTVDPPEFQVKGRVIQLAD